MKLTTYVLASAALIAVSLTSAHAQTPQNQRIKIGSYTIRPATTAEIKDAVKQVTDNFGTLTPRNPQQQQQRPQVVNSAPAPRGPQTGAPEPRPVTSNPAVTTPHTILNRPRPAEGNGAPAARPAVVARPQAGNGAPAPRPTTRPRPQAGNGAPAARPSNPAVTTPHTILNRPRPAQGNGAPAARPSTRPRPQVGNGAPAARPTTRPRPQTGNGAPAARPSTRPRPQVGNGAPRPRGPIVRDHRQPNRLQHTSVVPRPRPRTSQRQVRDHRNYEGKSLSQRRQMQRFK